METAAHLQRLSNTDNDKLTFQFPSNLIAADRIWRCDVKLQTVLTDWAARLFKGRQTKQKSFQKTDLPNYVLPTSLQVPADCFLLLT